MTSEYKRKMLVVSFLLTILYSLHLALPLYINYTVLNTFFSDSFTSLIFATSSLVALIVSFKYNFFLRRLHNYKFTFFLTVLSFISTLLIGFVTEPISIGILFFLHLMSSSLILINLNLFVDEFRDVNHEGSVRGMFLTLLNTGIMISPLLAGQILNLGSYTTVYIFSAIILIPFMYLLHLYYRNVDRFVPSLNLDKFNFKKIWRNRNLSGVMVAMFTLKSFLALLVIYTPLYLTLNTNVTLTQYVGILMPFALIPFVLLPYELGILADTKIGEKELMLIGLGIILIASLLMPIIHFSSLITFGIFLFVTRIGASILESMSFIYFFKKVNSEEVTNISLFNNLGSATGAIVPLFGSVIFYFTSNLYYLFYVFSALCIYAMFKTLQIKDTL